MGHSLAASVEVPKLDIHFEEANLQSLPFNFSIAKATL